MKFVAQYASNEKAHKLFYNYVRDIISRTNRYTGLKYVDDPTIMSWQIGNEPRAFDKAQIPAFEKWLSEASALIRSIDKNHLISLGSEGAWGCEDDYDCYEHICADKNIDYCNVHLWPYNWGWAHKESLIEDLSVSCKNTKDYIDRHLEICDRLNKPLVMEEFGYPRDGFSFSQTATTKGRDGYYKYVFSSLPTTLRKVENLQDATSGDGEVTLSRIMSNGRSATTTPRPAQEQQGLNSVFASDSSTIAVVKQQVERMTKLNE